MKEGFALACTPGVSMMAERPGGQGVKQLFTVRHNQKQRMGAAHLTSFHPLTTGFPAKIGR